MQFPMEMASMEMEIRQAALDDSDSRFDRHNLFLAMHATIK